MGVGKGLEEGWWAFKVKVDGADKRGYGIKGSGSGQRRQAQKCVGDVTGNKNAFDAEINPIYNQIG
jgi:hypothetical protein